MAIDSALGRLGIKQGVCTSSTRPTNPFEGQVIYESDTNRTLVYDNAAWVVVADNQVLSIDAANSRVGIRAVSPDVPLHVDGDAGNNEIAKFQSSQTAATYSLVGITDANETASAFVGFNPGASLNNTDSYLMLGMGGDDVNGGNGLIVKKGGSVGIGTNSPSARLDVNGETQASYVTLDRGGISLTQPAIDVEANGVGAGDYNYFLRVHNDVYSTSAVGFVNGSTRTGDGGPGTFTLRNDNGTMRLGNASYPTILEGTSVTKPGVSAMFAVRNAGNLSGVTDIVFNVVHLNQGNDYNASTGKYTAPVTGIYFVAFHGMSDNNVDVGWLELLDGVTGNRLFDANPYSQYGASATQYQHASFAGVVPLNAGDSIKVGTRYGLYATGNAHNSFSVYQIG